MEIQLISITPVLPSANIGRDVNWYKEKTGFEFISGDEMYAILKRDNLFIHLQWQAPAEDDPY